MFRIAAFILAIALTHEPVLAQQSLTGATVGGGILDTSGARIAGATVTVTNQATNFEGRAMSDAQGRFRFASLPGGEYVLRAEAPGFAAAQQRLSLSVGQAFEVSLKLSVASNSQIVEVNVQAPVVETARTQSSSLVNSHEVSALPLNGRNYLDLALLVPGVSRTNTGAPQRFAETSAVPGTGISVSGQRNLNNSFVVDGLSANDDAAGLAGTFFSQEVIDEFQVVSSGGTAEYGRASGGVINVITRSGTNTLHGDAYGFLRNQELDAKNALSGTKLPLTRAQYGATLGGPLVRNRTFYFANFEQLRENSAAVLTIAPANVALINARLSVVGYPGERIATGSFPTSLDGTTFFLRVDHRLSGANQLTMRYNVYNAASENARNSGGLNAVSRGTGLDSNDQTFAANDVWMISPRTMLESRFLYTRSRLLAPVNDSIGPAVNIAGVASFGTATFSPTRRDIDMFEAAETASLQLGRHALRVGGEFLYDCVEIDFPGALQGVYTFSNMANFLNGTYVNFQQAFGNETTRQNNPNVGVFAQDEWRIRKNVVINAGLRYELQVLPEIAGTDINNFSPRIGVAWDPWGRGRTVLRASYGIYYDRTPLRAVANALQRDGLNYTLAVITPTFGVAPTFPNVLPEFPSGLLTSITSIDPNLENSYSKQANVEIEQQMGKRTSLLVGYTRVRGAGLLMSRNVNVPTTTDGSVPNLGRPDPRWANISQYQAVGNSWYDGLTVSVNQRTASWGSVRVSYTFSKALDTAGNFFFSTPQNNFDIAAEKGLSDNDQRHRLVMSGTLYSPSARSENWHEAITHGWLFSYIYSYASAPPFNILAGADLNGDTNANDRPVGVGRNTGVGFGSQQLDVRVSRSILLTERWRLEAMVDVFNGLNQRNNLLPNNVYGTAIYPGHPRPGFGTATAVGDPRQIQLGLKLAF